MSALELWEQHLAALAQERARLEYLEREVLRLRREYYRQRSRALLWRRRAELLSKAHAESAAGPLSKRYPRAPK